MPNLKFPPSVEIKRAIAAAIRAGVDIGSVEIHPRRIIIHAKSQLAKDTPESAYDRWSAGEERVAPIMRQLGEVSDSSSKKPKR